MRQSSMEQSSLRMKKTYNGKVYDRNYITIIVDDIPHITVPKHIVGAVKNDLINKGINETRITTKYAFNL